jgi:cytochrome c553
MHIVIGFLIVLLAIQAVRPDKNISAAVQSKDISTQVTTPPAIKRILETACYDCHSNNTHYPWYAEVQPVGWILTSHVRNGKRHLNFSEFTALPAEKAKRKLKQIAEEVSQHEMPMASYTWLHSGAKLSEEQVKALAAWATQESQFYPSLPHGQ